MQRYHQALRHFGSEEAHAAVDDIHVGMVIHLIDEGQELFLGRLDRQVVVEGTEAGLAAGLALGAIQSEATLLGTKTWWPAWAKTGIGDAVPFLVVIGVLFISGRSLPSRGSVEADPLPEVVLPRSCTRQRSPARVVTGLRRPPPQ